MTPLRIALVITVALGLLGAGMARADSVSVEVSSRSIAVDDDIQVKFVFEGNGEGHIPDLSDWNILGQHQGRSFQFINGRSSQAMTQTYSLSPKRTGALVLAAATILRDGQVVAQSQAVTVQVRGAQAVKPSDAKEQVGDEDITFLVEVSRDHVYVGEPFVVTGVVYIAAQMAELDASLQEVTPPESVQREDIMPDRERVRQEGERTFKGRVFTRFVIFQEAWRVLRPETIAVPSLRAVVMLQTRRSMFGEQVRVKTAPVTVEVRAVPPAGRPASYREGAIGQFQVTGSLTPDATRTRAVLEVVVAGQGSLKTLDAPTLPPIAGARLESLPSDERDIYTPTANGVTGQRVFQYLVTPERVGVVQIPPIDYCWFNPETAKFETGRTDAMQYDATEGVAPVQRTDPERPTLHRREIQPIATSVSIADPAPPPLHRRIWFLGLLGIPFLAFLSVEGWAAARRRAERGSGQSRVRRAAAQAQKRIAAAKTADRVEFFVEIAQALRGYVEDRHDLTLLGLTHDGLRTALRAKGHSAATIEALVAELEACDFARFAPSAGTPEEMAKAKERATALVTAMENER